MKKRTAAKASLAVALMLCATLIACGDDGNTSVADAALPVVDAVTPDAMSTCVLLEGAYGDLGAATGTAIIQPADDEDPTGPQMIALEVALNQDAKPDVLLIELWGDAVPFESGFITGSFGLGGNQADLFECGACVYIAADREAGQPLLFHMASSGVISIDSVDPTPGTGSITGSLSNVVLREVTVSKGGQTIVEDGCRTRVDALSFDFDIASL